MVAVVVLNPLDTFIAEMRQRRDMTPTKQDMIELAEIVREMLSGPPDRANDRAALTSTTNRGGHDGCEHESTNPVNRR